jgi:16S rRNA G966 N2-methylase RsmD
VTFVEQARDALKCLDKNIQVFQRNREVTCSFTVVHGTVSTHLRKLAADREPFQLVFADPPYGDAASELLREPGLPALLTDDGLLVLESAKRDALTITGPWERARAAVYGDTRVAYLRANATSTNRDS